VHGLVPGVAPNCPDLTKPESVIAFDFASNFKVEADVGAKLKAATAAAIDIKGLSAQIDADLKASCGGIAHDLGMGQDFKDGTTACEAAKKAIEATRAKLGANVKVALAMKPPRCHVNLDIYADCAGHCDASVSGGKAKVECQPGKLSGRCDASCEGSCDVEAGAKCEGTCSGTCDADMKGTCSGTCEGKCDGKDAKGATCTGTCEGKCQGGQVHAECKGKCQGDCKLKASAKCEGTCTGHCSTEFKAPKCSGEVTPPKISADCKAHCDANASAKADCTPAQVSVSITGGVDLKAAEPLKLTLQKNLPLVLKVAVGMGERAGAAAAEVHSVVEGAVSAVSAISAKGGAAAALTGGQLTACLSDTFQGAIRAAGSIKANVSVSASVSASASGSVGGATNHASGNHDASQ
jgi:hypothetical protein